MNNYTQHKQALETEREKLKDELSELGIQDPLKPTEWTVKQPDLDIMTADENEAADKNEEYHINSIVLDELTVRYNNIQHALQKIDAGTYGTCEMCGEPIEADRLEVNPAARNCKAHMSEKSEKEV